MRSRGFLLVAAVVASLALGAAVLSVGLSERSPPAPPPKGYYVLFPDGPRGYDGRGRAILDAETNFPDGTLVDLSIFSAESETPTSGVVLDSRITLRVANSECHDTEIGLIGSPIAIRATIRAEYDPLGAPLFGARSPPPPVKQPGNVIAVLGPNFEHLVGTQARTENGEKFLEAFRAFELPAETCTAKRASPDQPQLWQVPVDQQVPLPRGPFPKPPFTTCPDARGALQVEAGDSSSASETVLAFDAALMRQDTATLRRLADASVRSFRAWNTGSSTSIQWDYGPGGYTGVWRGCGALVSLRTAALTLGESGRIPDPPLLTYLLILRPDGWKVWGQLPGDGR